MSRSISATRLKGKSVCVGGGGGGKLQRDLQPQLFSGGTVQSLKAVNDRRVYVDAVDLVFHKDGVALAYHRQDAR